MTTIKTAGSTALGDDYDTIAEVLADIPADLTATSGDWIVEFRGGFDFDGFTIPLIVTDATHQLIFRAIAGDEVDGTGTGAGFQGTVGGSITFIQTITGQQNDTHFQIIGLKIHAESGYGGDALNLDDVNNKVIKDCFITSKSGNGFTTPNAAVCIATFENCIIADCTGSGTSHGNAGGSSRITMNRVTSVNNGDDGFDDRGFGPASFIESYRNLLSFGNTGNDFNSRLSDSNVDYFAGGDGTQSEAPINFTATSADFANYAGGDYSLAAGSSLRGAGENGEDIGATLPAAAPAAGVDADAAFSIDKPLFASTADVTLPQPISDVSYTIDAPTFASSATATLPQPIADISYTVVAPTFASSAAATLPQPLADVAYTINSPTFSASAEATIPGFNASAAFEINKPTFSATATATQPQPVADVSYSVSSPLFSSSATATLPQPVSDIAYSIASPTFSASATATEPGFNAVVDFSVDAPLFSASAEATLPQPQSDVAFTLTTPQFSVVAIVGGIAIIVDNETNINVPALANNINAPALSNNVRI